MANKVQTGEDAKLRVNTDKLTESQLNELAELVVRKLKEAMKHESERAGQL